VEFRTRERWDFGIPYSAVLIHRKVNNKSVLIGSARRDRPNLDWKAGDVFTDHGIVISILSIDPAGSGAKVRVVVPPPWEPSCEDLRIRFQGLQDEIQILQERGQSGETTPQERRQIEQQIRRNQEQIDRTEQEAAEIGCPLF